MIAADKLIVAIMQPSRPAKHADIKMPLYKRARGDVSTMFLPRHQSSMHEVPADGGVDGTSENFHVFVRRLAGVVPGTMGRHH